MAVLTQEQLKALFESGDLPTQADFVDLIDTSRSSSAVKITNVIPLAAPKSVWEDFNETITLIQTTQQINIILYLSTYYMFNGDIDTYGLGAIASDDLNFIQISASVDTSELPVVNVRVITSLAEGIPLGLTALVSDVNATDGFTHGINTITRVWYKSPFLNSTSIQYLFNGAPGDYGSIGTTVNADHFVEISRYEYYITNSVRQISVPGTDTVWADFNLTQVQIIQPYPMSEILVVLHNNTTYLFNPDILGDGNSIAYGIAQTPTNASHFIGISASANPTIDIIRQDVAIDSASTEGTPLDLDQLVIDINNGSIEIIQEDNTLNIINHYRSSLNTYANSSSANYLFTGPNDTYGNSKAPVNPSYFSLLGQDDYQRTNTAIKVAVGGSGTVWDDFNTKITSLIVDSTTVNETYVIGHDKKTYLFNPEILNDGNPKTYGINGNTTANTSNFIQISDDNWIGTIPVAFGWVRSDDWFIETANVTRATLYGITGILSSKGDINYSAKMNMRGYIQMNAGVTAGIKLIDIVSLSYYCTNPKVVYLSNESGDTLYKCTWGTDGLYATEVIPDLVILDLDSHYYYDNDYTVVSAG